MSNFTTTDERQNQNLSGRGKDGHLVTGYDSLSPVIELPLVPYAPPVGLSKFLLELSEFEKNYHRRRSIPTLSSDVVPNILSYCDAITLSRTACVCREWHQLSQCNKLWEQLCRDKFGVSPALEIKPRPDPIKQFYILSHQQFLRVVGSQISFGFRRAAIPTIPMPTNTFQQVL